MLKLSLLAFTVAMVTASKSISYKDCGSNGATIMDVYADKCTEEPCTVHRGHNYTGSVQFEANKRYSSVTTVLHGRLGEFSIRWPVDPEDACETTMNCPLKPHRIYIYPMSVYCPIYAPRANITTKWELKDENNDNIVCFILSLIIR